MLDDILTLQIIVEPSISIEESKHLIKQLECANLAKVAFIKGELSFSDFCDILSLCGLDIDEYIGIVESNLQSINLL